MSDFDWQTVDTLVKRLVDESIVSGCCLSVRFKGTEIFSQAYGFAEIRPNQRQATVNTVWDLASLTKSCVRTFTWYGLTTVKSIWRTLYRHFEAKKNVRIIDCLTHILYPNWRAQHGKYQNTT